MERPATLTLWSHGWTQKDSVMFRYYGYILALYGKNLNERNIFNALQISLTQATNWHHKLPTFLKKKFTDLKLFFSKYPKFFDCNKHFFYLCLLYYYSIAFKNKSISSLYQPYKKLSWLFWPQKFRFHYLAIRNAVKLFYHVGFFGFSIRWLFDFYFAPDRFLIMRKLRITLHHNLTILRYFSMIKF